MKWFQNWAGIIGIVYAIVQIIEQYFKQQSGPEKKVAAVELTKKTMGDAGIPLEAGDGEMIDKAVDNAVGAFNAYGIFKHKKKKVKEEKVEEKVEEETGDEPEKGNNGT